MRSVTGRNWIVGLGLALWVAGCQDNGALESAPAEPAGGAITLWTDSTELFMEHPALIVGQPEKFAVHLTDLTDFAPLRSGRITLEFVPKGGGGRPLVVVQDSPRSPGIYGPAPEFKNAGVYDLTITVESPQARDVIRVPDLRVYATVDEAPKEEGGTEPGIPFLKEQQWKTPGFQTEFAQRGEVQESFAATGEIIPAAGRYAVVSAPISGLVDASSVASSPAPGQRVGSGTVLALLMPSLGESGSSTYASARRELREAEDEHERAKRLYAAEAIPQRRLHEAEIRLATAREALAGLASGGALTPDGKLAVRSPIAGVIAERSIVPGSRVEAGAPLFTVIDPAIVWLRANVPAERASALSANRQASFQIAGSPTEFITGRVISIGSVVDPASRSVPVIYQVPNPGALIKIGAIATVAVRTNQRAQGVVIPSAAILEEDGRPILYVQPGGERFERREITIGGSENGRTLVLSGLKEGERVVTGAAYQVRLASLSTAVPAHGHEH